jgi:hypothetical protein
MSRKRLKKSTWVSLALFIYVSVMAVYFLPRNTEISGTEKYITLAVSYVIVFILWLVLRKKEQFKEKRENENQSTHLKES